MPFGGAHLDIEGPIDETRDAFHVPRQQWDETELASKKSVLMASRLEVRVRQIVREAEDINSYELVAADGTELPPFAAGAHIDVHLSSGHIRQYSLCNSPSERHRYVIAVLDQANGRGGSRALHRTVRVGHLLTISEPRNSFPLTETATTVLLIAGGIGITPLMAMAYRLESLGVEYALHYCTRSPEKTAFGTLLGSIAGTRVHYHHDGGDSQRSLDVRTLLDAPLAGSHVYCCGPAGLIAAVKSATASWAEGTVHFEYFAAPSQADGGTNEDRGFKVQLARSGKVLEVASNSTILQTLRAAGVAVNSSCEGGTCGTCAVPYLEGRPDHRDYVLDDEEHERLITVCISRCFSPLLILDL